MWGQKCKDLGRGVWQSPPLPPRIASFLLGMGQQARELVTPAVSLASALPPQLPKLSPKGDRAQEPHCLGSHGKLRAVRQVKLTECSHKYLESKNQGLLSRVIPVGKKPEVEQKVIK